MVFFLVTVFMLQTNGWLLACTIGLVFRIFVVCVGEIMAEQRQPIAQA